MTKQLTSKPLGLPSEVIALYHAVADYQLRWLQQRLMHVSRCEKNRILRASLERAIRQLHYYRKQSLDHASHRVLTHYARSILETTQLTKARSSLQRSLHDPEALIALIKAYNAGYMVMLYDQIQYLQSRKNTLLMDLAQKMHQPVGHRYANMRRNYKRYIQQPNLIPKSHRVLRPNMSVADRACSMVLFQHGQGYQGLSKTDKQFVVERFYALMCCEDAVDIREAAIQMARNDIKGIASLSISGLYQRIEGMLQCLLKTAVKQRYVVEKRGATGLGRKSVRLNMAGVPTGGSRSKR